MSYAEIQSSYVGQTGALLGREFAPCAVSSSTNTGWKHVWGEMLRTSSIRNLSGITATVVICYAIDALPIAETRIVGSTNKMLNAVEKIFGDSASDMARILHVSRPMVYHYREGMAPSVENMRRLQTLAGLASEFHSSVESPLPGLLRAAQPEGKNLLQYLSDDHLDMPIVRRVLERSIRTADQNVRNHLAAMLDRRESIKERLDVVSERRTSGKPVYVGDPGAPGYLIQILPNGRRSRGRMVKRKFVPDKK